MRYQFLILLLLIVPSAALAHYSGGGYDPFYQNVSSVEHLRQHYGEKQLRILIVPGHAPASGGTNFGEVYERDLNVALTKYLKEFLAQDENFNIFVTREGNGAYTNLFEYYLSTNKKAFDDFIATRRQQALNTGLIQTSPVSHNTATEDVARDLYAINLFANENKINITLHVHLNDYAGRPAGSPGRYSGFAVYVPSQSLPNGAASLALGVAVKAQLVSLVGVSDLPGESTGLIEESELIALGSNASRDNAAVLVEYGYIYEPQFVSPAVRELYLKELAYQTYLALNHFVQLSSPGEFRSSLNFSDLFAGLKKGLRGSADVLRLQLALRQVGFYPPVGHDLGECPVNGNFFSCTYQAVIAFQEAYAAEILYPLNLTRGTGYFGVSTLAKIVQLL